MVRSGLINYHDVGFLRLVWDARQCEVDFNGLLIVARPRDSAPFSVQAVVEEEDTHRVLGTYQDMSYSKQTTRQLVSDMVQDTALPPGHVVLTGKYPKRLLAIIHDLEQEPTWRVEWVNTALQEVFNIVERYGFRSLALPVLGSVHGHISAVRFVKLMRAGLDQHRPACLERLWLILPPGESCRILQPLKDPVELVE